MVQQVRQIFGHVVHHEKAVSRAGGLAEPREVAGDCPTFVMKYIPLAMPHAMVEREGMQQDEGHSAWGERIGFQAVDAEKSRPRHAPI
jgi:hypothetical protein